MKVLIVGAGPTGLTAAVELARLGIIASVIEKKPNRSTLSRAVGILPNSLRLLIPCGVTARLLDQGTKIDSFIVYKASKLLATISLQQGHQRYPFVLGLAQDKTEQVLEQVFKSYGGQVDYGLELVSLKNQQDTVSVEFADGSTRFFDFVLGADGVNSRCRQSLQLDFPGYELNERWSIADVDAINWPHPCAFTSCIFDQANVAVVVPLGSNRYRLVSNTKDVLSDLPLPVKIEQIRRQASFNIAIRQVRHYRAGRVYLAGDAAHCHSPVGGRGMNLGIADACAFARHLNNDTLNLYSESRHTQGEQAIKVSERFRSLMTRNNPVTSRLVSTGFALINRLPALQALLAKNILGS